MGDGRSRTNIIPSRRWSSALVICPNALRGCLVKLRPDRSKVCRICTRNALEWWALPLWGPSCLHRVSLLRRCLRASCLFLASSIVFAQGVPPEAFRAKTVFIRNNAGGAQIENAADEELSKWGRFTLADDEASADIVLVFSKNGVTNTESSDEQEGRHLLRHELRCKLLARCDGARVSERAWTGTGLAALLAGWLRRHDAEGDGQRLHRCVQEAVSAIGEGSLEDLRDAFCEPQPPYSCALGSEVIAVSRSHRFKVPVRVPTRRMRYHSSSATRRHSITATEWEA